MTRERLKQALRLHQSGDLEAARTIYESLLAEDSNHAEAMHLLGVIAIQSSDLPNAIKLIEQAVTIRTDQPAWFGNLGTAKSGAGDFDGAIAAYQAALRINPAHVESHYNLAHVHRQASDLAAAESSYREAIRLSPSHAGALNNLATCLREQGRSAEAVQLLEQAVQTSPQFAEGYYNLGNALRDIDRTTDAIAALETARDLLPDSADIHASLGMTLLATGDFQQGLPLYEARQQASGGGVPLECTPRWDGSSLDGKTIAVFAEQGLGDTLQFVRYVQQLKMRATVVYLVCQKPLVTILSACFQPIDGVFAFGDDVPDFDVAAPLLSLPLLCETTVDSIPSAVPYLEAESALAEQWQKELGRIDGFRIGIAWQGAPGHLSDVRRSIPLAQFEPIVAVESVNLIALQKGFGIEQIDEVPFTVHRLPDDVDETYGAFMDTAAIMMNLDMVITSDTSIAHLAGAMGVPVWIALATGADWRWMVDREDSPWYPSATLYRQSELGDWDGVFQRMAAHVSEQSRSSFGSLRVEVSAGELLDKIAILQIKKERISDESKLANICRELDSLEHTRDESIPSSDELESLVNELRSVNESLWDIEDDIRECERQQDFGDEFIQLARQVYITNDRRSDVKRSINKLLRSRLVEEKSYAKYQND